METLRLPPAAKYTVQYDEINPHRVRSLLRDDAWLRNVLSRDQNNLPGVFSSTQHLGVFMDNELSCGHKAKGPQPSEGLWFCVTGYAGARGLQDTEISWSIGGDYHGGVPIMARPRSLQRFLRSLPLMVRPPLITRLDMHLGDWLFAGIRRRSLWRELFGQFPALRLLVLGGWECIEAVTRTLEADPTLLIQLKGIDMCINGLPAHDGAAEAIPRWLAARRAAGASLESLVFDMWTGVSLETTALVDHLTSEVTQHGGRDLAVQVVPREFCEACQRPAIGHRRLQDTANPSDADVPDTDSSRPGAAAKVGWKWGESDDEESESDAGTD